jgi:hypothetical protein
MLYPKTFQALALSLALLPSSGLGLSATLWTSPIGETTESKCGAGFRSLAVASVDDMLDAVCYWTDAAFTSVAFKNADFSDDQAIYAVGPASINRVIVLGENGDAVWGQIDPCSNGSLESGDQFNGCLQVHHDTGVTGGWILSLHCIDAIVPVSHRQSCTTAWGNHAPSSIFNDIVNSSKNRWHHREIERRLSNETNHTEGVCDWHAPKPDNCVPMSSRRETAIITCVEGFEKWKMPEGDTITWHTKYKC